MNTLHSINIAPPKGARQCPVEVRHRTRTLYYHSHIPRRQISQITKVLHLFKRHAIDSDSTTIQPRSGRSRTITPEQEEELIEFVGASTRNRRMTFLELSINAFEILAEAKIKGFLRREGERGTFGG